jgi:choline dehydrogenase-like flavoprotein
MNSIVIGSGIAGSNAALSLLEKGDSVELWDVGKIETLGQNSSDNFLEFKKNTNASIESLIGFEKEKFPKPYLQKLFQIPPLRNFLLNDLEINNIFDNLNDFEIYQSFNKGGLANGWGANVLPYNNEDLEKWDLDYFSFTNSQKKIFNRIPISKVEDDLNEIFNIFNFGNQEPIRLDHRDEFIISNYKKNINFFKKHKIAIGKARLAINNSGGDNSCTLTSRCLWGCPNNAIYNPKISTLEKCKTYKNFRYLSNRKVHSFNIKSGKVDKINISQSGQINPINVDAKIYLSAGAIQSGIIFLNTLIHNNIDLPKITTGLMDTKKIKVVYIMPKMIGTKLDFKSIQFNRLIGGMKEFYSKKDEYIHLEFLNLNSLFFQPLINSIPLPLKLSKKIFYSLFSSIGVCTYFLPDYIEEGNKIVHNTKNNKFIINYLENSNKLALDERVEKKVKSCLLKLGAIPVKTIKYKSGAAIHYAGTIPMGKNDKYALDLSGKVKFLQNLFIADSSAFPSLPSKPVSINAASFADYVVSKS